MFGVALLASALLAVADARIYERCELARDLLSLGVRREHLATWVCIAFHESRFDTAARNPNSGDHGILQISELYWCGAGKACGLPCSALRDDDISDDVECALQVYEEHTRLQGNGFLAWVVYPQHCKHNAKKYLADCESSVKTPSLRTNGRPRVLKSQNWNVTNISYNPKIDELLPPYLAIGSLFRGNYEKEFEQNYNNKVKVNWLNYKIDNIDNLKLPVFSQMVMGEYTTATLATTTTTTPSPLLKIKPPSPRRIESNSFRHRMMRPTIEPVKFSEITVPPTSTSRFFVTTTTPRNIYRSTTANIMRQDSTPQQAIQTTHSSTSTTTGRPSTERLKLYSSVTALTSIPSQQQSTKSPFSYTANAEQTTFTPDLFTRNIDRQYSTISSLYLNSTTKSTDRSLSIDKTRSTSFDNLQGNVSVITSPRYYGSVTPKLSLSSTTAPTVTIKNGAFNFAGHPSQSSYASSRSQSKAQPTWRTTSKYRESITTTTSKPSPITWRTVKPWSTTLSETTENILTTQRKSQPTTSNPWTISGVWPKSKPLPTAFLESKTSSSSTRTVSTTPKPYYTTPGIDARLTPTSSTSNPKSTIRTLTSTELPSPTTARTTQSIFDLYLNPTKRPKLPAFSFTPFKSKTCLKIFAGGTTTHPPTLLRNDRPISALQDKKSN